MKQFTFIAILAVIVFFSGYLLGRKKAIIKEVVKYEKQEPVIGSTPTSLLRQTFEFEGSIKDLPNYYFIGNTKVVDTVKIISDFMKLREYSITLFDNGELGKLDLKPTLQYNQLASLDYSFSPIQKTVTRTIEKKFKPFASVSYSTIDVVGLGGGFFYKNLGLEYLFNSSTTGSVHNYTYHTFSLKYKF